MKILRETGVFGSILIASNIVFITKIYSGNNNKCIIEARDCLGKTHYISDWEEECVIDERLKEIANYLEK